MFNANKIQPGTTYPPCANAQYIPLGTINERADLLAREIRKQKDMKAGLPLQQVLHRFWHMPLNYK